MPTKSGQGVLVPGGFILTAAHCIWWDGDGAMALGGHFLERISTKSGAQLFVNVMAAEPVADIAVLDTPDNQAFYEQADAFEAWCNETAAVPVSAQVLEIGESMPVHILTHKGTWIRGEITRYGLPGLPCGMIYIKPEEPIEGGTSGGPVVDAYGRLVGLVSWCGGDHCNQDVGGMMPVAHLALPRWIWERIAAAQQQVVRCAGSP